METVSPFQHSARRNEFSRVSCLCHFHRQEQIAELRFGAQYHPILRWWFLLDLNGLWERSIFQRPFFRISSLHQLLQLQFWCLLGKSGSALVMTLRDSCTHWKAFPAQTTLHPMHLSAKKVSSRVHFLSAPRFLADLLSSIFWNKLVPTEVFNLFLQRTWCKRMSMIAAHCSLYRWGNGLALGI